ncbi:hypothetical protein C5C18_03255 [Rathayibacter tritici]|nr:hypothetical protein C5C06_04635 [Rathayibacter tritici]PPF70830.1 hypothetical protein C5C21_00805 [Rathayibacter tritici]PPG08838.1 hypothetical protein C5C18_03255 [Rathayibacter tritici]PPI14858.1 hypothetical protein C5D07_07320 [Rathayibacter tritici]PPI44517.1 hypothetical protein C5D18_07525 [Rathayibacter tritici]
MTTARLALLAGLVLVLTGLAALALVPAQYATLSAQGFDDLCRGSLGGVPPEAGQLVRGFWSWWPLGAACEWTLLDGTTVVDRPDWSTTAVAIVGAVLFVLGAALAIVSPFLRRRAAPAETA